MTHFINSGATNIQITETLGMNVSEYEAWKEEVQMDAIQLPRHVLHWVGESMDLSIH